jgi:hypothetical protein
MLVSEFVEGTKSAQVHSLAEGGYRIIMKDSEVEVTYDTFTKTEEQAETLAEDWVLKC